MSTDSSKEEHPEDDEPLQLDAEHYRKLCTLVALFVVLYSPQENRALGPAGEDLMDWLNTFYVEPSSAEGARLTELERPWEDDYFWLFLQRCVRDLLVLQPELISRDRAVLRGLTKTSTVMFNLLNAHPSEHLRNIAHQLGPLVESQPRTGQFNAERDFAFASRRWKDRARALRVDLLKIPEDARDDGFENWWQRLSEIVGLMEGRADVLRKLSIEMNLDWKEYTIVWSLFVDPRLRRGDLP